MATETEGTTETTSTESTSASTQESSQAAPADANPEGGDVEVTAAGAAGGIPGGAYTPNLKFKVHDQEKEFDPWMKDVIKDVDTEKKVRELYEKAHGLDFVKQDRQKIREENQTLQGSVQQHQHTVATVNDWIGKKDYDSLFQFLRIPQDDVLKQAMKILQFREMPPEQRQVYEAAQQERQRSMALEAQNQQLMQTSMDVGVRARTQELDWTMSRPEVSTIAQAYDAKRGVQGAFRQAVVERGKYHAYATGQDISAEQAIQEVIGFLGGPQAFMGQQAQVAPGVQQQTVQERKPVITNIQGRGTSPAKKVIRSMDDLKKRAKELSADA